MTLNMEGREQRKPVEAPAPPETGDRTLCLSFNSYSSDGVADVADKVVEQFRADEESNNVVDYEEEDEFEFTLVRSNLEVTADEMFFHGQVRRFFPIFNRDVLIHDDDDKPVRSTLRLPLKKLFTEDIGEPYSPSSSSSSEAVELEGVAPGTYCVWRPNVAEASPSRCKKSKSTGSASKTWKLRDLLWRSNSDSKSSFVFLTPKRRDRNADKIERAENSRSRQNSCDESRFPGKLQEKSVPRVGGKASSPPHEVYYVQNRARKEGNKRKSFLPYRKDLLGFFANVNSPGRSFPAI
ncbi:uncharacterized protein LOC127800358 [Diospyros lotus]|uniref:uncharacterized protein LOC127800358 n=1 Tax=Diospyros lotus TaxID=55363 RepID=UPI0022534643|nr:uncharacterized protein LOC127800358 [Diospyros lotus]